MKYVARKFFKFGKLTMRPGDTYTGFVKRTLVGRYFEPAPFDVQADYAPTHYFDDKAQPEPEVAPASLPPVQLIEEPQPEPAPVVVPVAKVAKVVKKKKSKKARK